MSPAAGLGQHQGQRQALAQMPRIASRLLGLNQQDLRLELSNLAQHNPFLELAGESERAAPASYLATQQPTLKQFLHSQLEVMPLAAQLRDDCESCLDSLDGRGFLPKAAALAKAQQIPEPRAAKALAVIRSLNPVGVGAHDLAECLLLQLAALPERPGKAKAQKLIENNFALLARGRIDKLPSDGLLMALEALRSLQPTFANDFASPAAYLVPDLAAVNDSGVWRVQPFDHEALATLHHDIAKAPPGKDGARWRALARQARAVLSALEFRSSTLLRVAQALIDRQRRFFTAGRRALRPVGLRDLALDTGLSISTISTTLRHKSLSYPGGVITLKYFLQRKTAGGHTAAAALQEAIRRIVEAEDPDHPLSDEAIMTRLQAEHGKAHRRTIAKHRKLARIPPAHLRRARSY